MNLQGPCLRSHKFRKRILTYRVVVCYDLLF